MKIVYRNVVLSFTVFSAFLAACDDNDSKTEDKNDAVTLDSDENGTDDTGSIECEGLSEVTVDILEQDIELEGQTITKTINTVLVVNWEQTEASDSVKLQFTFEDDEWFESPAEPGTEGAHEIPVLGVPELTDVTIQIVSETDGEETVCEFTGTTGKIPQSVPRATVPEYDPSLASGNRWMLGTVEKTPDALKTYGGVFTVYIIDRKGRIVWYYLDQAWTPVTAYPRIALDGTHFYFDRATYLGWESSNQPSIARTTLDLRQFEAIDAPSMTDSMDITDRGSFVYNSEEWLVELTANGRERNIWNCPDWMEEVGIDYDWYQENVWSKKKKEDFEMHFVGLCYSNSVVWNPLDDTVLLSFPNINTVVEVSRQSGELVGQWGEAPGSWQFEPASIGFVFEHGANITPEGTLLVSTHEPVLVNDFTRTDHYFIELELDRDNQVATEIWRYGEGLTDFPVVKGEVFPVDGGNRLLNYGGQGLIREVTPDLEVAWEVSWEAEFDIPQELIDMSDGFTEDHLNNMVGHNILIDDLYALNEGWSE